eukprot:1500777-Rhodomonas_salina.1
MSTQSIGQQTRGITGGGPENRRSGRALVPWSNSPARTTREGGPDMKAVTGLMASTRATPHVATALNGGIASEGCEAEQPFGPRTCLRGKGRDLRMKIASFEIPTVE